MKNKQAEERQAKNYNHYATQDCNRKDENRKMDANNVISFKEMLTIQAGQMNKTIMQLVAHRGNKTEHKHTHNTRSRPQNSRSRDSYGSAKKKIARSRSRSFTFIDERNKNIYHPRLYKDVNRVTMVKTRIQETKDRRAHKGLLKRRRQRPPQPEEQSHPQIERKDEQISPKNKRTNRNCNKEGSNRKRRTQGKSHTHS